MSIDQDIAASARQLEADVKINHQITHGGDTVEVPTEGGPVPSIRKRLKDIETEWSKTADPLADDLASTVQVTKGYKDAAANSAAEAAEEVPKVQAEGARQVKAVTDQGTVTIEQVKTEGGKQTAAATAQADRANREADAAAGHNDAAAQSADAASDSANLAAAELPKVTAEGAKQVKAVQDEGGRQVSLVINEGTQQTSNAKAHADRAEQARTGAEQAENRSETSAEQSAASATDAGQDAMAVSAIADKFGNVNQAITEATEQADRAATSADEAKGHAQSADAANTSAVNAKEEAKTAATEAKAAEDNATAIVHNDEGSVTPKAGAYPVADNKGHLDIGWTPLLQAMYPYSGVIGSVDKGDLFGFRYDTADWANRFEIKPPVEFNIAGRFVRITDYRKITLPEAESTADRAIAFDDIFLDWNGNIQTYRSITPYRTTTGYDRDLIATEHGYTKVQTGLYKTGDTYALLLGRVARRNKGGFHPVYNPEGSGKFYKNGQTGYSYDSWYGSTRPITSKEDCFKNGDPTDPESKIHSDFGPGSIAVDKSVIGRPDQKYYDAIYADDFTPLYYSAKNIVDRQALLFDSFNRAVAGETFSGAEGTHYAPELINYGDYTQNANLEPKGIGGTTPAITSNAFVYTAANPKASVQLTVDLPLGSIIEISCDCTSYTSGKLDIIVYGEGSSDGRAVDDISATGHYSARYIIDGTKSDYGSNNKILFYVDDGSGSATLTLQNISVKVLTTQQPSARPQFLMVDIIGSLEAMPPEFLEHGIPGNWLAVGEEGESLIPDGTQKNFKLSRKCLECYQVLSTNDKGVTWTDATHSDKANAEGAGNTLGNYSTTADFVKMVFYRTSANPFELTLSGRVRLLGGIYTTTDARSIRGSLLTNALINKTPTAGGEKRTNPVFYNFSEHPFIDSKVDFTHAPLDMLAANPAIKAQSYLSDFSSSYCLQCIYKEMKHNGTQWGDDNKFNIVNKQSTVTDLNGASVIVGQKRVETFYQFSGETY